MKSTLYSACVVIQPWVAINWSRTELNATKQLLINHLFNFFWVDQIPSMIVFWFAFYSVLYIGDCNLYPTPCFFTNIFVCRREPYWKSDRKQSSRRWLTRPGTEWLPQVSHPNWQLSYHHYYHILFISYYIFSWPGTYLIFVIFFTQAKFWENKIYTEKMRKLRQNTQ